MKHLLVVLGTAVWLTLVLSACDGVDTYPPAAPISPGAAPVSQSAADVSTLLPSPAGYVAIEDETMRQGIEAVVTVADLDPKNKAIFDLVDGFIGCYAAAGAGTGRLYVDRGAPHSLGIVVIIDKTAASDKDLLISCATQAVLKAIIPLDEQGDKPLNPCYNYYEVTLGDRTYIVLYLGTTEAFCHDVCSMLPQCAKH